MRCVSEMLYVCPGPFGNEGSLIFINDSCCCKERRHERKEMVGGGGGGVRQKNKEKNERTKQANRQG